MWYASTHPERVEALFLQSPACTEPYDEATYDPYKIRLKDDSPDLPTKKEVDAAIQARKDQIHMQAPMHSAPHWLLKSMMGAEMRKFLPPPRYTEHTVNVVGRYYALMAQRPSKIECTMMNTSRHFASLYHSLQAKDRMMNPEIDFPVAFCFGDRDFFGSEGADAIVEANRHCESGRS